MAITQNPLTEALSHLISAPTTPTTTTLLQRASEYVNEPDSRFALPDQQLCSLLDRLLLLTDPSSALTALFASQLGVALLPEVAALDLDQGGRNLHKDNLAHSIKVVAQAPPRIQLRWACLCHDLGKPATRKIEGSKVTFYNHEVVGQKITYRMLTRLGYTEQFAKSVSILVEISGRTHGFDDSWTDSALRRFITDAGPLLGDALDLSRADCTSARPGRRQQVLSQVDAVSARIDKVIADDALKVYRPALTGEQIMATLGIKPGPQVGAAYKFLLSIATEGIVLSTEQAAEQLLDWWAHR